MKRPEPISLAWAEHDGEACLRLTGLTGDGVDAASGGGGLAVVAGEIASSALLNRQIQPMAGRFVSWGDGVDFVPRFPFLAGATYSLVISPCVGLPEGLALALRRERPAIEASAIVTALYPDVEAVPFNLLKVYVCFSEPMAEGAARRGVRVEDARTGAVLDGVFLDMDPELWDPERRRLTLLLDPGRIKRGLAPHEEAGYPLSEGAAVRIAIGEPFRSATGAPLRAAFSRVYAVGSALRRPVDPEDWRLTVPEPGSRAPLAVAFDRPLDRAMLEHAFQVVDAAGRAVAGSGALHPGETGWSFQPSKLWASGEHRLIVQARLEDLAGNSLRRVFDRDLTREGDLVTEAETVSLRLVNAR